MASKWEMIDRDSDLNDVTERMRVAGGYLYRTFLTRSERDSAGALATVMSVAMTFVPAPPKAREDKGD